ncbi:unnamed protein product [Soboliphyme baturini]|uniref:DCB domain-containing protein n=1 Tax=Soboliphyme baturini TaxID=241478 RepID=A0A183ITG4_9BILA|nr:unnamed protein product [Soboliphyme baturini]
MQKLKSDNVDTALDALLKIDALLKDPLKRSELTGHVDQLITAICCQLRIVRETHLNDESMNCKEMEKLCKDLLLVLLSLLEIDPLATEVTENPLRCLIAELIIFMVEKRLEKFANAFAIQRSVNVVVLSLIEHTDKTACGLALLRLLMSSLKDLKRCDTFRELTLKTF